MIYWIRVALLAGVVVWLFGAFALLATLAFVNGTQGKVPAIESDEIALTSVWPVVLWVVFWHWIGERRKNRRLARERQEKK